MLVVGYQLLGGIDGGEDRDGEVWGEADVNDRSNGV